MVLVTGDGKASGLACAGSFAAKGARVAIASRSAENLEHSVAAMRAEGVELLTATADAGRQTGIGQAQVRSDRAEAGHAEQ